jgi:tetratricopeptide (TPR) repeat protein
MVLPMDGDTGDVSSTVDAGAAKGTTALDRGQMFARYRIDELLGQGGMGQVYGAYDTVLRRRVALKVLRPSNDKGSGDFDPGEAASRILREARAAAALDHRSAVAIFDVGEHEGVPFIAMERVNGTPLRSYVGDDRIPLGQKARWLVEIARVLGAAHAAGLVHRDVKPENVMVCKDRSIKVLDFGIARRQKGDDVPISDMVSSGPDAAPGSFKTTAGRVRGTPRYMAPERFDGETLDARSDQFAWGIVAYELIAGSHPSLYQSVTSYVLIEPPRPLTETAPGIPFELAAIVMKALAQSPNARHPDMETVANAVEPFASASTALPSQTIVVSGPGVLHTVDAPTVPVEMADAARRRPRWMWSAAALVVASAVAGGVVSIRAKRHATATAAASNPTSTPAPAVPPGPPLVLILGFDNRTPDPIFDGALDVVLDSALHRSDAIYPVSGGLARELLVKVGADKASSDVEVGKKVATGTNRHTVTVRGTIAPARSGFEISLAVTEGASGVRVASISATADATERIVPALARLGCEAAIVLGDHPCKPGTEERLGISASLDADHEYAASRGALDAGKHAEALDHARRAVELDPGFARARLGVGVDLWNAGRRREAREEIRRAIELSGSLASDYDRLLVDAAGHLLMGQYAAAIPPCGELVDRWPLEINFATNLALFHFENGDIATAVELGQKLVAQYPQHSLARENLGQALLGKGDLEGADAEVRKVLDEFPHPLAAAYVVSGLVRALRGDVQGAAEIYKKMEGRYADAASLARTDLFLFEGKLDAAIALLERGIAADEARKATEDAFAKRAVLGEALWEKGDPKRAGDVATVAAGSGELATLLRAGRVLAAAGRTERAGAIAKQMAAEPDQVAPLFARIVRMDVLAARRAKPDELAAAIGTIGQGPGAFIAHADFGAALLAAGDLTAATRELELCAAREGEGAEAFFEDTPTAQFVARTRRLLATVHDASAHASSSH